MCGGRTVVVVVSAVVSVLVLLMIRQLVPPGLMVPIYTAAMLEPPTSPAQPSCRHLFSVNQNDRPDQIWDSERWYRRVSEDLPTLLGGVVEAGDSATDLHVFHDTRLALMNGSIPYLPCKVREYGAGKVGRCSVARAARGAATWITFVGDSNQRQKVHSFLRFLPKGLDYIYYLGKEQVSQGDFIQAVAHHDRRPPTFDIIGRRASSATSHHHPRRRPPGGAGHDEEGIGSVLGASRQHQQPLHNEQATSRTSYDTKATDKHSWTRKDKTLHLANEDADDDHDYFNETLLERDVPVQDYEFRVTLVWAPAGSTMDHPTPRQGRKVTKLLDLASTAVVPDVIVIGFGTWVLLMREFDEELVPFTELDRLARPLIQPLTALTRRTTVLFWRQSRYRWFSHEAGVDRATEGEERERFWKSLYYNNQFNDTLPLVDVWLWNILRETGMWYWDSTLPFNLANIEECRRLSQARLSKHTTSKGNWWNCLDAHHSSYETNSVEIQMLFNFLCNEDLGTAREYCCTGK